MGKEKKQQDNKYSETLNLPKTDFPMRGNLPKREPEILAFWKDIDIYEKVQAHTKGKPQFILHDGPPYANGNIHLGHTLNKVLKDMIVKSKSQVGLDAPYVPGWDTHGLPIELKAIEQVGLDAQSEDKIGFRDACADYAKRFVAIQKEQFQRLGVRGDWANPYLTLSPAFEAEEIGVFGEMAQKGYIYKGLKPVHWCPHDHTALAEAEIEYGEQRSPSIYVTFRLKDGKNIIDEAQTSFVIWTTTPWTLPANQAVCLNPEFEYQVLNVDGTRYIVAKERAAAFIEETGLTPDYQVEATFLGKELEGMRCHHPFFDRDSLVVLGAHVTLETGTGCVHTAPGHGQDDYVIGKKYGLPILSPLDEDGKMTEEAGQFAGLSTNEANKAICKVMEDNGNLLKFGFIKHQYPNCWRCGTPTLFRATDQWFASIDGFREAALQAISNDIAFTPEWGRERIYNMIRDRGDWCISRQRLWGVPIPVFYCNDCDEIIIEPQTITHIQELVREHGTNCWFAMDEKELLPPGYTCPKCGGSHFTKEEDIMDVWFDSGSSHQGVLKIRPELRWPADLYLEGSDQHRGWFNSSLCTSVAMFGKVPYKGLLTHGFVVDEQGRKMSKKLGNGVDPLDVIERQGADILRLWVSSTDYRSDVSISNEILKQVSEAYRKIRNTFRYLLGSLYDFNPQEDRVSSESLTELDRWAMMRIRQVTEQVTQAYDQYDFHVVYRTLHHFCNIDLSSFYFDIIKDRLYSEKRDGTLRRACQTVLYDICLAMDQLLTPILAFTTEEVFRYIPMPNKPESVQLAGWPTFDDGEEDKAFQEKWDRLIGLRDEVTKPLEVARREKTIGNSLDAQLTLYVNDDLQALLDNAGITPEALFIVSKVVIAPQDSAPADAWQSEELDGLRIVIQEAPGEKCPRCWKFSETFGYEGQHEDVCSRCAEVLAAK